MMLAIYSTAIFLAALIGGGLPRRWEMTHTRTQLMMSFVSGLMLGVAIFHLIPHSAGDPKVSIDFTMRWVMLGLLFMLLLLRLFHFHQHDFATVPASSGVCDHDANDHAHHHAHDHAHVSPRQSAFSWVGLALGLSVHTLVDGVALGAVLHSGGTGVGILGLGVFLAIMLHKPLDAMSIEMVMTATGWRLNHRRIVNVVFASLCPLAAIGVFFGLDILGEYHTVLPALLGFSAGAFICIALGDLLPEVQFHSHDRVKLTLALFAGIGAASMIGLFEVGH
jgi:zinc and cadmium transporter